MTTAQISDKWQITLPAAARRALGLKRKGKVEVEVRDAEIVLRPVKSVAELYGVFHEYAKGKTTDWDEIREETYRIMAEEYRKDDER